MSNARKLITISALLMMSVLSAFGATPRKYNSFKVSSYIRAQDVIRMQDKKFLEDTWERVSSQVDLDKIYIETHRDSIIVDKKILKDVIAFFKSKGLEVGGGITYTISERNEFETYSYARPADRLAVKHIAEYTASFFDDIILDDFFFIDVKNDAEIAAKGDKSWTEYRLELMAKAGKELVVDPAHKVNPKVKVIIKYPNWYDHFHGLGFNLDKEPKYFDGLWTGTETRDPGSAQHLQNYLSYNIIRYFDNIAPGKNGGGWVDAGGIHMGVDRYAEQVHLTMISKTPEIILWNYMQLNDVPVGPRNRREWQGDGTSFDYDAMMAPFKKNGKTVTPSTLASVAKYTLLKDDAFVCKLGNPVGLVSYKPYHSTGEDFLQNYLGMIGLPMDMHPSFLTGKKQILLTQQAAQLQGHRGQDTHPVEERRRSHRHQRFPQGREERTGRHLRTGLRRPQGHRGRFRTLRQVFQGIHHSAGEVFHQRRMGGDQRRQAAHRRRFGLSHTHEEQVFEGHHVRADHSG